MQQLGKGIGIAVGRGVSMVMAKVTGLGGETPVVIGTNSNLSAHALGLVERSTFFTSSTHVSAWKWCRQFGNSTA